MMTFSRPFAVLLTGLFLLHLVVAGSGLAMGVGQGAAMQGMQMAASSMSELAEAEELVSFSSESEEAPCSTGAACEMPGMPNSCQSTLPCQPGVSLPERYDLPAALAHAMRPAPLAIRAPHARLSPPELPPPRA